MYLKLLIVLVATVSVACGSNSEEAGPVSTVVMAASPEPAKPSTVGSLAGAGLDPVTCEGALAQPEPGFTLDTHSPIASPNEPESNIVSLCTAGYTGPGQPGAFLTVGVIMLTDEASAVSHYELVRVGFVEAGLPYEDVEYGARDLIFSEINQEGLGRIYTLREGAAVISVHTGPTLAVTSMWPAEVMLATANDLAARLNALN